MADEIDRNIMPEILHTTVSVSLGAWFKSLEMMTTPQESIPKVMTEVTELFTLPAYTGAGLQDKAQAMAGLWISKGVDLMESCKSAGEKFTKAK
jgi:hypothetical protein